ncbi:CGNR zinc finger domain-containing protein [Streptomyces sp. NBC_01198]|uniref:CGNR zinc finger domain-containing protein n=1 Tax=Streptomyces sp. NBC_01198 TaxID=2903769 RepID=UPI002E15926B|nr:CGNR zinc finger domain-containing protein [Streptomyces sp. NBC_01198]
MAGTDGEGTTRSRVPAPAGALVALLNSRPHAEPLLPDRLDDQQAAAEILQSYRLPDAGELTAERLDRVRALRADLMAAVEAADADRARRRWEALSAHVSGITFRLDFADGTPALSQVTGDPLLGGIVAAVADILRDGTWQRVRVCANDGCRAVFYDTTRSRTQRWHSYELCGNRANVAAFRARENA